MEEHSGAKYAESILKESPLYLLYDKFNRTDVDNIGTEYCKLFKHRFNENTDIFKLCKMFEKNTIELPSIMKAEGDSKQHCRYLTFWINDKIRSNFITHKVAKVYHNYIILKFLSVSDSVNGGLSKPHCKYYFNREITLDKWKKWKDLYDYIRNKNYIEGIINSNMALCKIYPEYYSYIEGIYNNYKEECCKKHDGNCPSELHFKEWCTPGYVLTKLTCNKSPEHGEPSAEHARGLAAQSKGDREAEKAAEDRRGKDLVIEEAGGRTKLALSEEGLVVQEVGPHVPVLGTGTHEYHTDSEGSDEFSNHTISNPTGTVIGTSLGFVLPLITIYRFTPLGSWINTKIFRKKRLMENMKRNERELLLNSSGIGEMNFDNARYQIMYNSAHNE